MSKVKISSKYFQFLAKLSSSPAFLAHSVQEEFRECISEKACLQFVVCAYYEKSLNTLIIGVKNEISALLPLQKYKTKKARSGWSLLAIKVNQSHLGVPPSVMKSKLRKKERGLTVIEGLWTALLMPSLLKKQALDLLDSQYGLECVPTIYEWKGKRFLSAVCPDVSDKMCGAPIVKKEVPLTADDLSHSDVLVRKIRNFRSTYFK